jgi:hypothetical protein
LLASRIALVATASTQSPCKPLASQNCAKTSSVASARAIGCSPSSPLLARPSPMRTGS